VVACPQKLVARVDAAVRDKRESKARRERPIEAKERLPG
jgi:hypothetical protein